MPHTITTDRLILRPHTATDFAACCELWTDPEVVRFIGGRPSTGEEVWRRILAYAGHWQLLGFGYLLVTERTTGAVVGEVGIADFHREVEPPFGDTPEAGWAIRPQFQGRGLAGEAVGALLAWVDKLTPRTVCMIDPENAPSLRLAERLGFREYLRTTYKDHASILMERHAG